MKAIYLVLLLVLGYSFSSCEKDDPQPQRIPRAISITGIELLKYPASKADGSGWDFSTGPDIFMTISRGNLANNIDRVTTVFNNASPNGIISFTMLNSFTINDLSSIWTIGAYDSDDFDPDDFIAGGGFAPIDHQDDLPSTLTLTTPDGSYSTKLYLTWNF
jgi:hypothetical protein